MLRTSSHGLALKNIVRVTMIQNPETIIYCIKLSSLTATQSPVQESGSAARRGIGSLATGSSNLFLFSEVLNSGICGFNVHTAYALQRC